MAGNITLTDDSGTVLASDEADGAQVLRVNFPPLSAFCFLGLGTTAQVANDSASRLCGWHLANAGSVAAFVKLYNNDSAPTVGTDVPVMTLFVPAGGVVSSDHPGGVAFTIGIAVAATTGGAYTDTGAPTSNTVLVNLFYINA